LQLTCDLLTAVEIRPGDPQHLDPQSRQRAVAGSIGVEGPPGVVKGGPVDLDGKPRLGPIEVDAVALDELGPRIGKAVSSTQGAKPALCLASSSWSSGR
jgi:hypothetical protein